VGGLDSTGSEEDRMRKKNHEMVTINLQEITVSVVTGFNWLRAKYTAGLLSTR
jgi:hypothetical protein